MKLDGEVALITGGGSGLGYATAQKLLEAGARVWVCDTDQNLIDSINQSEIGIHAVAADAGDEKQVKALFDALLHKTDGRLDILVNNAGIAGPNGALEELELADWNETLRVNLVSTYLCCRESLPVMKRQRSGSIVNLSSTAGTHGFPLRTPYAAAKWGIIGLTKSLAMEVGTFGIRVNAICPGSVSGPRMDRVIDAEAKSRGMDPEQVREQFVRQTSLRCFVEADDIAAMILFVCSNLGAKISGQALAVDGHTESLAQIG